MSEDSNTFLYFAFGSNLLKERILIKNPSAVFKTIAKLEDHCLEFSSYDSGWHGAGATINPQPGSHVWGVVWEMNKADLPNIDRQENVDDGIYRPITVTVLPTAASAGPLTCRSYQLAEYTPDCLPSPQYLSVICRGAEQSGLPAEYQDALAKLPHNGFTGEVKVLDEINKLVERFREQE